MPPTITAAATALIFGAAGIALLMFALQKTADRLDKDAAEWHEDDDGNTWDRASREGADPAPLREER